MSFGYPIATLHQSLFIKNPAGAVNFMAYLEPFTFASWSIVVVFCLLTSTILFCVVRYEIDA